MYILDTHGNHSRVGVSGEIYIGGSGVALGYWQDAEKTNDSFIIHKDLGQIYKTGDLGKWNKNGYIEFIGRKDNQHKIRGYRIELGGIESVLSAFAGVKQSIIRLYQNDKNRVSQYIIGYFVSKKELDITVLMDYLKTKLPHYMVPHQLICINRIPLTINGKLDYKMLPQPVMTEEHYIAPNTNQEKELCMAIAEILSISVDSVGVESDFFNLGGNSLLAIKLVQRLKSTTIHLNIKDVFIYKTVRNIINAIKNNYSHETNVTHICINDNGNGRPLFLLPPSEGGAESYLRNLCTTINPNIPLYVFNNYYQDIVDGLTATEVNELTYTALAKQYISTIKKIQPTGPYSFFGWSFGGILSFEIISQLISNGDEIYTLMLLDSIFDYKNIIDNIEELSDSVFHHESINYKYMPQDIGSSVKIVLFKTKKKVDASKFADSHHQDMIYLLNYITDKYPYNGLDNVLKDLSNITVREIEADHIDWHLDQNVVNYITHEIESILNN